MDPAKDVTLRSLVAGEHRLAFWSTVSAASLALWYLNRPKLGGRRGAKTDPADFHGFLKVPPRQERDASRFDSFLKGDAGNGGDVQEVEVEVEDLAVPADGDVVKITVMFGTEYGLSKEVAEKLCKELRGSGKYWPSLRDMATCAEGFDFSNEQVVLIVCSTQGDGVPPAEAREFCDWLFNGGAGDVSGLAFSVCALGDRSYAHFCQCGKKVHDSLTKAGGHSFVNCQEVDRENWKTLNKWIQDVVEGLSCLELRTAKEQGVDLSASSAQAKIVRKWGKSTPYSAEICKIENLCNVKSVQDKCTVLVEFDLGDSGIEFLPGDALGVYPQNCPEAVDDLLRVLGTSDSEQITTPPWYVPSNLRKLDDAHSYGGPGEITLRQALTELYDIKTPKPSLYSMIWDALEGDIRSQAQPLIEENDLDKKASKEQKQEVKQQEPAPSLMQVVLLKEILEDEKTLAEYEEERHLIDILADFNFVNLSLGQILSCLRQLQPRLYSISSSPLEDSTKVGITVAEVVYSSLGSLRKGVASTFLTQRSKIGDCIPVYVFKNPDFRLPDLATPIIMVGPGTGLAPFRAFICERLFSQSKSGDALGKQILYFGCRSKHQDYLYGNLLENWSDTGKIELFTAFSRDQENKIYVQHRLWETKDLVWDLLQEGAHFYVCGDAASMAGDVERVLLDIFEEHRQPADPSAANILEQLASDGRYQRDVWF